MTWIGLILLPPGASSAAVGPLRIARDAGQPVLCWSNVAGGAFLVESCTNISQAAWQKQVTLTSDASSLAWAEEGLPAPARYYRVSLVTNGTIFGTLQAALVRGCTNQGIVGASAAALLADEGLWVGTFGTSDGSVPIRPETPFEVGSVTKTLVAATVLRLAEEGKLGLEDTVGQWLPNVTGSNIASSITIRQLLGHRGGVYNFGDDLDFRQALFADWSRQWQPQDDLKYVKTPYFFPGADGEYSNTGYVLLGLIIRSATGATVAEEMRRTVLEPAGLRSTYLGGEESGLRALADPHLDFNGDGLQEDLGGLSQRAILTSFWTSGAGISTAADLARFGRSLFEGAVLTPGSLDAMRRFLSIDIAGTRYDYGLGLFRFDILSSEYWGHSGGLFGEYAWFSYCPSNRVSLGVAYNYPVLKSGPNLLGELLIALSTWPQSAAGGVSTDVGAERDAEAEVAIRFPFPELGLQGGGPWPDCGAPLAPAH